MCMWHYGKRHINEMFSSDAQVIYGDSLLVCADDLAFTMTFSVLKETCPFSGEY